MTNIRPNEGILDHILYVIVLPAAGSGEFTPFQGFSFNSHDAIEPILRICELPATIDELFTPRREVITRRAAGLSGYAIALLELEFLSQFKGGLPFTCIISTPTTGLAVEEQVIEHSHGRLLHLTLDENAKDIRRLRTFSRRKMFRWFEELARRIVSEQRGEPHSEAVNVREYVPWKRDRLRLPSRQHNIVLPSETALTSVGYSLANIWPIVGATDEIYETAIIAAADEIERVRRRATAHLRRATQGTPSLIVTVPSVFRRLSPHKFSLHSSPVRRAVRSVLRQQQYTAFRAEPKQAKEILEDQDAKSVLWVRAMELKTYTAVLSVSAASLCAPVLRLPPQVDRIRELLLRLDGVARTGRANHIRINALARRIGQSLRESIPSLLVNRIEAHVDNGIKLIGDTPLELLPIGDLPLSLRTTTSRMPTLPGTLMMRQCLMRSTMLLKPRDFRKVLIVRAFEDNDPLRDLVTMAIDAFHDEQTPIEYRVVDVNNTDEFVSAFNAFDGAVAIFDGHGSHARSSPQGTLKIGKVSINPFELYAKVNVPPIVLLSACDTHPLDGVESSVASAFLFMGARSVLGTTLPVDGRNAAILIGRFMHRFSGLLPHITSLIPWSEVVAGMLRMSYVTDVLRGLGD